MYSSYKSLGLAVAGGLLSSMTVFSAGAQADDFLFGANEQVVYSTSFQNADGLTFTNGSTNPQPGVTTPGGIGIVSSVVNGVSVNELHGNSDCFFCSATHRFGSQLNLDNGDINAYFSFRSIPDSQDSGVGYLKLNFTDDPSRIEQLNLTLQIRPSSPFGFYNLLVNPGFGLEKPNTQSLMPPANQFQDTQTYESFRMQVRKVDANTIEVNPYWFDKTSSTWQLLMANSGSSVPLRANIGSELEGLSSFFSADIQFFNDVPYANGFAVTQELAAVPEPNMVSGLLGFGVVGGTICFQRRRRNS